MPRLLARVALVIVAASLTAACQDHDSPDAPSPLPCSYAIAPASQTFEPAGGPGTITVSAREGCDWQAASDSSWIAITSGARGTANGIVAFAVSANPDEGRRTGAISVNDQTFTISQTGRAPCVFEVSPQSLAYDAAGGAGSIAVSTSAACAWTASSSAPWISIASGTPGEGSGVLAIVVARQDAAADRSGTLTVAGQLITVAQRGAEPLPPPVPCEYGVAPTDLALHWHGTATDGLNISITAPAGCLWTATTAVDWLQVVSGATGRGTGQVRFTAGAYLDQTTRRAPVQIRWPTPTEGQNVWITQEGCYYAVSATSLAFMANGGSGSVMVFGDPVSVTCSIGCPWSAVSQASWIRVTSSMPRAGDDLVNFQVDANATGQERTGTIQIGPLAVTIRQTR